MADRTHSHDTSTPVMSAETVPSDWNRADRLLYTLAEQGYHRGKPVLVNALMVNVTFDQRYATAEHADAVTDRIFQALSASHLAKEGGEAGAVEEKNKRITELEAQLAAMEARKDGAYEERNRVVAALAKVFPSGTCRTDIPGWSADWHGCVRIDLPTGQVSWHFHDTHAYLFADLPAYAGEWDGHDTPEKYHRLASLPQPSSHLAKGGDAVGEALEKRTSKAERNRIVDYLRDFAKRVEPKSASANNFNAAADAIVSGHAFPGGNPDTALASLPDQAGAAEPVALLYEWTDRAGSTQQGLCFNTPADRVTKVNDQPPRYVGSLYTHPDPEAARLREDLERVTRERDNARRREKEMAGEKDEAFAELTDAVKALETAREDERDRLFQAWMDRVPPTHGVTWFDVLCWFRDDQASMQPPDRDAARSASSQGGE